MLNSYTEKHSNALKNPLTQFLLPENEIMNIPDIFFKYTLHSMDCGEFLLKFTTPQK